LAPETKVIPNQGYKTYKVKAKLPVIVEGRWGSLRVEQFFVDKNGKQRRMNSWKISEVDGIIERQKFRIKRTQAALDASKNLLDKMTDGDW
jgi:hypothetical protein